jgi:cytochrome P450
MRRRCSPRSFTLWWVTDESKVLEILATSCTRPPEAYADLFADRTPVPAEAADGSRIWLSGTHQQVKSALTSKALSADPGSVAFPPVFPRRGDATTRPRHRTLSAMDGQEHAVHRRRVAHEFSRAAVDAAGPRLRVQAAEFFAYAEEAIDDYASELVTPYVHDALATYFVDSDPALISLLEAYEWSRKDPTALTESSRIFRTGLADLIRDRMGSDDNDLVARLARQYHADDRDEAVAELVEIIGAILVAGTTTTISAICIGTKLLVDNPFSVPNRARADHGQQWLSTVNEILRFSSIADLVTARTTIDMLHVGGASIPSGSGVIALTGAANHDPSVFPDPALFDPARTNLHRSLAFGHGIHVCLGRHLAVAMIANFLTPCFSRDVTVTRYEYSPPGFDEFDPFPLPNMAVRFQT